MKQKYFPAFGPEGFHRLAYTEWGAGDNGHAVICAHGLTRNGRDFDVLAEALQRDCRALCFDTVGRGKSDWLNDAQHYDYEQYVADAAALIARASACPGETAKIDWVGTSMGGLVGLMLAAAPHTPLRRLVLNDIGPYVPASALRRLGEYVGKDPAFGTLEAYADYLKTVHADFGDLTRSQWGHLAEHGYRLDDGVYRPHYDPAIGAVFDTPIEDVRLWALWERVSIPVLVLRGERSDLLTEATLAEMRARKPETQVAEFAGAGHAPALMEADQIRVVKDFLLA
jgi:pimeloyl-ACP methyl ester carboxylesterase